MDKTLLTDVLEVFSLCRADNPIETFAVHYLHFNWCI